MTSPTSGGQVRTKRILIVTITLTLGLVVLAPIALSSQHIYEWARAPLGLDLPPVFAVLAFVALDLAAVMCVAMTIYSGLRGEPAGVFGLLIWVFALGSAWINYQAASTTPSEMDGPFFAAMSVAGPVLFEATLAKLRRWTRQAAGTQMSARPKFGGRWLPGVAFRETLKAWAAARRENIARPEEAIAYVRERAALADMTDTEAIRYAWSALGSWDEYSARLWLQARGRNVSQAAMDEAVGDRPRTPITAHATVLPALPPGPEGGPEGGQPLPAGDDYAEDRALLAGLSKRDQIRHAFASVGSWDVSAAMEWLKVRGIEGNRNEAYTIRREGQDTQRAATLRAVKSS